MDNASTNEELLEAWRSGDESAASVLFSRYQSRLLALVRSRLSRRLARRVDPEDIVLSAYRSFFTAARTAAVGPNAEGDLWPLLVTMTLRKLARQARRHGAESRDVDREQQNPTEWWQAALSGEPTPEDVALIADEIEQLLADMEPSAREVAVRLLQGDDGGRIAAELGLNERTVRRVLSRIRERIRDGEDPTIALSRGHAGLASCHVRSHVPASDIVAPTLTFDQVVLREFLAAGAFTKVYRGTLRPSEDVVAVKFLRKECWSDPRAAASLFREAQILRQLSHPNILTIRGWGTTPGGVAFLVTDYIAGVSLEQWRQRDDPSLAAIVSAALSVADALAEAHAHGVLHCDLKPANVLRRDDGRIVLCDFGLARWAQEAEDVPRGGTAGFLCPEQICDAFGPITERSDVYGLGGLLYALLTGRAPFAGRDLPETLANVLSAREIVSPTQAGRDVGTALDDIIRRCLRKEPQARFGAVTEVIGALRDL